MGFWSSVTAEFELHCIKWDHEIEFVPTYRKLNYKFIHSGFYTDMPFGYDAGYPDVKFEGDFVDDLYITVSARDEGLDDTETIKWFRKQIDYLHPFKAKLVIREDFGSDTVIKYKNRIALDVIKGRLT